MAKLKPKCKFHLLPLEPGLQFATIDICNSSLFKSRFLFLNWGGGVGGIKTREFSSCLPVIENCL